MDIRGNAYKLLVGMLTNSSLTFDRLTFAKHRSVVQIVAAHPSVVKGGGVTLECDDGGLPVSRDVFALSSPLMADLLGEGCTSVKVRQDTMQCIRRNSFARILCACLCPLLVPVCSPQVSGSTKEEWLLVISQLYPIVPHPELSLPQLQQVLPVVHKARDYNFPELLQYVCSRLATELPSTWSLDPSAPGYIIKWLVTAEQLQLDALKQAALEGLKKQPDQRLKRQLATKKASVINAVKGFDVDRVVSTTGGGPKTEH
ncbi:hypothetical protein QJQ45_014590 [Haematococcus lacustris]|nr:hypothetical protein QJQ45_014590 [Haematococcus lacustris]